MKKTASLLSICGALLVVPQAAHSRCSLADSDRLQLWCAIERGDDGIINAQEGKVFGSALIREGYAPGTQGGLGPTFYASPIIEHSENVNGGNPDGPLVLGELRFFGDERLHKEEGWLAGGAFGFTGREHFGPGRYFEFSTGASLLHAPAHDAWTQSLYAKGCSRNHLQNWWYADACYLAATAHKELSQDTVQSTSIELSKAFTSLDAVHHLASVGAREHLESEFSQTRLFGDLHTIHGEVMASHFSLELGEEVEGGYLSLRRRVTAGTRTRWQDLEVGFIVSAEDHRGGQVLGHSREDLRLKIGLSVEIRQNVELSVGYEKTDSSISYFDSEAPVISLRFAPYLF